MSKTTGHDEPKCAPCDSDPQQAHSQSAQQLPKFLRSLCRPSPHVLLHAVQLGPCLGPDLPTSRRQGLRADALLGRRADGKSLLGARNGSRACSFRNQDESEVPATLSTMGTEQGPAVRLGHTHHSTATSHMGSRLEQRLGAGPSDRWDSRVPPDLARSRTPSTKQVQTPGST